MKSVLTALTPSCTTLLFLPFFHALMPTSIGQRWLLAHRGGIKDRCGWPSAARTRHHMRQSHSPSNNPVHDLRLNEKPAQSNFFSPPWVASPIWPTSTLPRMRSRTLKIVLLQAKQIYRCCNLDYNKFNQPDWRHVARSRTYAMSFLTAQSHRSSSPPMHFWECPSLSNLDLSSNKLARLDPSTFTVLGRLVGCELAGKPFPLRLLSSTASSPG